MIATFDDSILSLNFYCLGCILNYLAIEDGLNFADTCSFFRHVFKHWIKLKYDNYWLLSDIYKYELKLLSINSENIRKLCIDVDDLSIFLSNSYNKNKKYFLKKFCRLLKEMHCLESVTLLEYDKKNFVKKILLVLKDCDHLQHLQISGQKCDVSLLRRFKKLEFLSLKVPLSSKDLLASCQSMKYLRILHLSDEVGISTLKDVIHYCPDLHELSFHIKPQEKSLNCMCVGESNIFSVLADKAKNLKTLTVSGIISDLYQAEELASISSLKILKCNFFNAEWVRALSQLSLLEEFRIVSIYSNDCASHYLELIKACPKLYLLSIMDYNIPNDFALQVAKVQKEFVDRRPLKLLIYGHRKSTIDASLPYIDSNHIIYCTMSCQETIKLLFN